MIPTMTQPLQIADGTVPTRAADTLEAEVDGELVLLGPSDLGFFGASGEGDRIWGLVDGSRSVGDIVATLEAAFTAPPGVIRAETLEYLEALHAADLIVL